MHTLAPPASAVPDLLALEPEDASAMCADGEPLRRWLDNLLRHRHRFGITRVGSLTRLDRIGVPVVQVVRPLALSNAVSQGKGVDMVSAAVSGIMESLETWAAERIPEPACHVSKSSALGADWIRLFSPWADSAVHSDWESLDLSMIDGWDLASNQRMSVPLALVDTVYAHPSPHPSVFPRVTTGLGAGASLADAILQGGLEVLERHALTRTHRTPYFYERFQIDLSTITEGPVAILLRSLSQAGLITAAWLASAPHTPPVYRCHVMEADWPLELAPMPAEGSACRFTSDDALLAALLEACQARSAVIAGAREDMTRRIYPSVYERERLAEWRDQIRSPGPLPYERKQQPPQGSSAKLQAFVETAMRSGADAVIVVPLYADDELGIYVVRVLAPPLHLWPSCRHG